jgi:hypothetical protein
MTWVRLDDKRALNGKLLRAGFEARGLDDAAICFAALQESDGFISEADVAMLASGHGCAKWRKLVDTLVAVGRWEPAEKGWMIHDYLEFNPSRAQVEERRKRDRVRKDSLRNPNGNHVENPVDSEWNPSGSRARGPGRPDPHPVPVPVPTRPDDGQVPLDGTGGTRGQPGDRDRESNPEGGTTPPSQALLERLTRACTGRNRVRVRVEAVEVLAWARGHVSDQVIDEAIGYCTQAATHPALPRAVAEIITRRAADAGMTVPAFKPVTKTAEVDA